MLITSCFIKLKREPLLPQRGRRVKGADGGRGGRCDRFARLVPGGVTRCALRLIFAANSPPYVERPRPRPFVRITDIDAVRLGNQPSLQGPAARRAWPALGARQCRRQCARLPSSDRLREGWRR